MICNRDQQPQPIIVPATGLEFDPNDSLQPLSEILPGVLEEIRETASDPVKQANRNLNDLQHRRSQGDLSVSDADIAAAKGDVEDALVKQLRPPQPPRP